MKLCKDCKHSRDAPWDTWRRYCYNPKNGSTPEMLKIHETKKTPEELRKSTYIDHSHLSIIKMIHDENLCGKENVWWESK